MQFLGHVSNTTRPKHYINLKKDVTKLDKKTSLIFLLSIIDNDLITTHNYQDILGYSRFVSHGTMPSKIHLAVDHLARASLRVVTFFFVRLFLCVNGRCIFISCCLIPFNDPTEILLLYLMKKQ